MANIINIQSADFVTFANKLEKIGRADLPVAVRSTLNQMAFEMKGTGSKRGAIGSRAEKDFDYKRNKSLFRVMTGASKASGLDINKMQSEAGIINKSGRTQLAEGLAAQQEGGTIKKKATPLTGARTGRSISKRVRKPSYLQRLDSIDLTAKKKGRYHAHAMRAFTLRKTIVINGRGGTPIIARIRSIKRERGSIKYRLDYLYRINDGGQVSLTKKRPFVNRAAQEVMKGMPREFIRQANRRIEKSLKK